MNVYIRKNYEENKDEIVLLEEDFFKEAKLCEAYTGYSSNLWGCEDAGCISLDNSYSEDLFADLKKELNLSEKEEEEFPQIGNADEIKDWCDVNRQNFDLKKWREENEEHQTAEMHTYWDGSNWKTLLKEKAGIDNFVEMESEKAEKIIQAWYGKELSKKEGGYTIYRTLSYRFTCSRFASAYEIAEVEEVNYIEEIENRIERLTENWEKNGIYHNSNVESKRQEDNLIINFLDYTRPLGAMVQEEGDYQMFLPKKEMFDLLVAELSDLKGLEIDDEEIELDDNVEGELILVVKDFFKVS